MQTDIDKTAKLLMQWRNDPVLGVRSLFGVEPDEQQQELIRGAFEERSRIAVKSCQGAGKTSTLVWIAYLMLLTMEDCRIMITSPSYQQLSRVFHSEAHKWKSKMAPPFNKWFEVTKEKIALKGKPEQMASLVTASAENEENLQGGHSDNYIVLADEASGIADNVFDVLLGTLGTGTGGRFIMTSNPIKNSGRFFEVFSRKLKSWTRLTFNAQDSTQVKQFWIEEMKEMYGEDSDFYKIRVLAEFPRVSEDQFIPVDFIEWAMSNDIGRGEFSNFERVMGVDVARFGGDQTVFTLRQGPKLLDVTKFNGLDTMDISAKILDYVRTWAPSKIFIDAIGIGAGVFDRCNQLNLPVVEVVVSTKSSEPKQYFNLRAQLWGEMRNWIQNGADIPNDDDVKSQLASMTYSYNQKMQLQLTSKKDLKRQGMKSPDIGDSLSLTFAGNTYAYRPKRSLPRKVVKSNYLWV